MKPRIRKPRKRGSVGIELFAIVPLLTMFTFSTVMWEPNNYIGTMRQQTESIGRIYAKYPDQATAQRQANNYLSHANALTGVQCEISRVSTTRSAQLVSVAVEANCNAVTQQDKDILIFSKVSRAILPTDTTCDSDQGLANC